MIKTPITVYVDFKVAKAIKSKAAALGLSQSQWLSRCANAALSPPIATEFPMLLGSDYVLAALDVWLGSQPDADLLHERIAARMQLRAADSNVRIKEGAARLEEIWASHRLRT